jgi:outer membrane protein OmpA-like peptidoglycan-associated protein
MKKKLVSIAITSVLTASSGQLLADQTDERQATNENDYTAIGVGAASGALIAGPAGLIVGGFIGSLFSGGNSDESLPLTLNDDIPADESAVATNAETESVAPVNADQDMPGDMVLASNSKIVPLPGSKRTEDTDRIKQIISSDLNVTVYFKPGSMAFESFYTQQFSVMLNLLHEMPELELNLDGYSDRQGSQADNLLLSEVRLESVRDYFVNNGIEPKRIHLNAYGEKNFMSTPGELESYMFDRRVVVSFKRPSQSTNNNVADMSKVPQL